MRSWIEAIVRFRVAVLVAVMLATVALASQIGKLRIEIDPNRFLPQSHAYVITSNRVEEVFGSRYVLVIGITPTSGDVYDPAVLAKVDRITRKLREDPGVVKSSILSFAARKAKSIKGTDEGMEVRPLMDRAPTKAEEVARLRRAIKDNPVYQNAIISGDGRSVAILADFKDDPKGFTSIMERVRPIVDPERDAGVSIALGGLPVMLSQLEQFSSRMGLFLPAAMLLVGFVLWLSFRSMQGLVLPLVTGLVAVLWSLGTMSAVGVPLDVFNATTPILIMAVAAGHAVQILKRYQEEFERLLLSGLEPRAANRQAVVDSLIRIAPVMLAAGAVAAVSFLSLLWFEISSIRTFGVFAACGIASALMLELTLIPALRSMMRPIRLAAAHGPGRVAGWMTSLAEATLKGGRGIIAVSAVLGVLAAIGATRVNTDDSFKQSFASTVPAMVDDAALNARFGGTNTLYVMVEGSRPGRMQDPDVLRAIDGLQQQLGKEPAIGKTISIVDFVRRMNRAMHGDDPKFDSVPADHELVAQYLFLYANGGDPSDFDTYVDYDYQRASIWGFLKEHDTGKLTRIVDDARAYAAAHFPKDVTVSFGGSVAQGTAIREIIVRAKLLNMLKLAGVVFVLAALVFRSLIAGVLVLIPLACTVLFNFGLLGWTGIPFNIANSITFAMAVGIGADYVIYFLFRLREEQARGTAFDEALKRTLQTAGTATFFVALAIAAGYSVLVFSTGFWNHITMGILISSAMLVSAAAALTLVPLIISRVKPRFLRMPAGGQAGTRASGAATAVLAVAVALGMAPHDAQAQSPSAAEVMQKNRLVDKVVGSQSKQLMTLRNRQGQERRRESVSVTRLQGNGLDNQRLTRFLAPADVSGTSILMVEHAAADDDMWIYLPALKKVRRLVASNKKDSFAGTDFSYGDVIGHAVEAWKHTLVGEETAGGEPCYVIESTPASEAVRDGSGYARRKSWISKVRYTTVRFEAWDSEGQLLKRAEFGEFREVAKDRWIAMRLKAINLQSGHQTEITFTEYAVDAAISADRFSTRALEAAN